MVQPSLTNSALKQKFKNNFDLCNFAINIARNIILSGVQTSLGEILVLVDQRASEAKSHAV